MDSKSSSIPYMDGCILWAVAEINTQMNLPNARWTTHQLTIHLSSILISRTPPSWPFNTALTSAYDSPVESRVYRSHTRTEQSLLPLTMKPGVVSSSELASNFKQSTLPWCPLNVPSSLPVLRDHTLMLRSRDPVMIREASNSKQYTLVEIEVKNEHGWMI